MGIQSKQVGAENAHCVCKGERVMFKLSWEEAGGRKVEFRDGICRCLPSLWPPQHPMFIPLFSY